MKRCSQCGTEVSDDLAVACPNCGSTFAPTGQGVPTSSTTENVYFQPVVRPEQIPFFEKLLRAARLDSSLYESLKRDPSGLREALYAIILLNVLTGLGIGVNDVLSGASIAGLGSAEIPLIIGLQILLALVKWGILTAIIFGLGVLLLRGTSKFVDVARAIGFAYAPIALQILVAFTASSFLLTEGIQLATDFWLILALVVAVKQTLDLNINKAIIAVVIAGVIYVPLQLLIYASTP
jgi:hypothetical protein